MTRVPFLRINFLEDPEDSFTDWGFEINIGSHLLNTTVKAAAEEILQQSQSQAWYQAQKKPSFSSKPKPFISPSISPQPVSIFVNDPRYSKPAVLMQVKKDEKYNYYSRPNKIEFVSGSKFELVIVPASANLINYVGRVMSFTFVMDDASIAVVDAIVNIEGGSGTICGDQLIANFNIV